MHKKKPSSQNSTGNRKNIFFRFKIINKQKAAKDNRN